MMADLIINDLNWREHCNPADIRCGTAARNYEQVPYGAIPSVPPRAVQTIQMEEWPDRIADKERTKSSLKHIWADSQIGVLNQASVSYCHAFMTVMLMMIKREQMGLPFVRLSASSIGGPVTGWRNAGAFIHDDLERAVKAGACSVDFCPMLTTNRSDCKTGWEADAAKYKVSEFTDVRPRNFLEHGSLLLQNHPVGVGLNYWGHAVTDMVLRDLYPTKRATDEARYGVEFLNSWQASWGNGGFGVRTGSKMYADAIFALYQLVI